MVSSALYNILILSDLNPAWIQIKRKFCRLGIKITMKVSNKMEPKIEFGLCMDAKKLHLHDAWTDVKRNYKLMSD